MQSIVVYLLNNDAPISQLTWLTLRSSLPSFHLLSSCMGVVLMVTGSKDAAELCIIPICAIPDFDTHATSSSPLSKTMTVSQEKQDKDADDAKSFVTVDYRSHVPVF